MDNVETKSDDVQREREAFATRLAEAKRADLVAEVARHVKLKRKGKALWGLCPLHGPEKTPSFKVAGDRFHCFACGAGGDVIDFVRQVERLSLPQAVERLAGGGRRSTGPPRPPPTVVPQDDDRERQAARVAATALWRSTLPIEPGTVAAAYLRARGCAPPPVDSHLRYLERHRHPSGYRGPALLALVTDPITVKPVSLHQTWILPDGRKAPVDRPRLFWRHLSSRGVCRLWPDEEVTLGLLIAEGIETSLSAASGFGLAWACLNAGNLENFPILGGIEALTIVSDHDANGVGQKAAAACARRWTEAGIEVRRWLNDQPGDFADWITEENAA